MVEGASTPNEEALIATALAGDETALGALLSQQQQTAYNVGGC